MSTKPKKNFNKASESSNEVALKMPKMKEVSEELESLKSGVIGLAHNLRDIGADKAHEAASYVNDQIDTLKATSVDSFKRIEKKIQDKPGQSVAIAFGVGLLASYLLGRKSS